MLRNNALQQLFGEAQSWYLSHHQQIFYSKIGHFWRGGSWWDSARAQHAIHDTASRQLHFSLSLALIDHPENLAAETREYRLFTTTYLEDVIKLAPNRDQRRRLIGYETTLRLTFSLIYSSTRCVACSSS